MAQARFRIRNWDRFQQYKDREPKWIKLHRSLNHNYDWCQLSEIARAHLVGLWLLAAETGNEIPLDPAWLKAQIGAKTEVRLDELFTARFIEPVQNCTELYTETERETETETERESNAPPKKRTVFKPPSVDEVEDYRREVNARMDAAAFVDFYEAKGWMVGKSKMKDWRAAVRNWARREKANGKPGTYTGMVSDL